MHLNYSHMSTTQLNKIFSSVSCVQQRIIPERLNQIYIAVQRWKEEILSFSKMYHISKSVTCIKFKGPSYDRSSTCEQKGALGINTISPISIDRSTLMSFQSRYLIRKVVKKRPRTENFLNMITLEIYMATACLK